jgi:hypothetical protein
LVSDGSCGAISIRAAVLCAPAVLTSCRRGHPEPAGRASFTVRTPAGPLRALTAGLRRGKMAA